MPSRPRAEGDLNAVVKPAGRGRWPGRRGMPPQRLALLVNR